jgi:hypothetical protein
MLVTASCIPMYYLMVSTTYAPELQMPTITCCRCTKTTCYINTTNEQGFDQAGAASCLVRQTASRSTIIYGKSANTSLVRIHLSPNPHKLYSICDSMTEPAARPLYSPRQRSGDQQMNHQYNHFLMITRDLFWCYDCYAWSKLRLRLLCVQGQILSRCRNSANAGRIEGLN